MSDRAGATAGLVRTASMEHLPEIIEYTEAACDRASVPEDVRFAVTLAVEEAFTNVVQHGYAGGPGKIELTIRTDGHSVIVRLADEAERFDAADAPAADVSSPLDERSIGGLGWHLIREMMDEVRSEPGAERGNVLTLVKHLHD